jgi:hypothetical protein
MGSRKRLSFCIYFLTSLAPSTHRLDLKQREDHDLTVKTKALVEEMARECWETKEVCFFLRHMPRRKKKKKKGNVQRMQTRRCIKANGFSFGLCPSSGSYELSLSFSLSLFSLFSLSLSLFSLSFLFLSLSLLSLCTDGTGISKTQTCEWAIRGNRADWPRAEKAKGNYSKTNENKPLRFLNRWMDESFLANFFLILSFLHYCLFFFSF